MKYLAWIVGVVGVVLVGVYTVAFTAMGNGILQPIIEKKIKEQTKLESKLSTFHLNMNEFSIVLALDEHNIISANGNYSLFSQKFNIAYKVRMNNLKTLKSLTNAPIRGKFYTQGTIKGDQAFMEIDGLSDVAKSDTSYHIELTELNPTSIIAKIKDAKLDSLLYIAGENAYASGDMNLNINFKNINPKQLDGNIVLNSSNGMLNEKLLKKDFDITIPKTSFDMNLDAVLAGEKVDYKYNLLSNLIKVSSNGKVIPTPLQTDIKYSVNIKELALLKPISGADIRGVFNLNGSVHGTKKKMIIMGKSDIASSNTQLEVILKELKPSIVKVKMDDLELSQLLYMAKQPHYTDGLFSLEANIEDMNAKLNGTVDTSIKKGLLDSAYMSKEYGFETKMPKTTYELNTHSIVAGDIIDTKVELDSSLATFEIQKARFNIADSSIHSDYIAKIKDLDRLFFVTNRHLKGAVSVNGELSKAKDLDLTILSNIAGGKIDASLHNDDFKAKVDSLQTLDILSILKYPEVFQSSLHATLDYNLATQKGDFNGKLANGEFTKNEMFNLVKKYAKVDLYRENFNGDVSAKIDKENILASLDLKSNKASIKTVNTKINSQKQTIDSEITVTTKKYPVIITLDGEIASPKVGIDYTELMKSEVGKKIKEEVLDTEVGQKVKKELDGFLKKFF